MVQDSNRSCRTMSCFLLFSLLLLFSFKHSFSLEHDSISPGPSISRSKTIISRISPGQSISRSETVISQDGMYELGFFSPGNNTIPKYYYLGIWKKNFPYDVVWVANRNKPLPDESLSVLTLFAEGNLVLWLCDYQTQVWSSNSTTTWELHNSAEAVLLDTGNLVLRNGSLVFWQSFDHPTDICHLLFCGAFGICVLKPIAHCECLVGFEPRYFDDWDSRIYSAGCVRKSPLHCNVGGKDTFLAMPNMQLPQNYRFQMVQTLRECEKACLRDCSCSAYGDYEDKCIVWLEEISNLGNYSILFGELVENIHVRRFTTTRILAKRFIGIIIGVVLGGIILLFIIVLLIIRKCRNRELVHAGELVSFTYKDLRRATKNFSEILGKGSFGTVYKGKLRNSTDIAVKKLHYNTVDDKQFRSEVNTIGMIQHINLIRLQGFCAVGAKRMLIYDYIPNGSLAAYLFGKDFKILAWKARYQIALGIARGLAYLHEKCRDCIIHCDIKPDNILLDSTLNPKVADFGLAKLLGRNFSRVLTTMRGTRGYLAPEWISGVPITPKADVYSYGMMLFEIISGRRNLDMDDEDISNYFPARVASIMCQGMDLLSLLDKKLGGIADVEELTRVCRIACWCIQHDEKDRPSMGHVVNVLEGILQVDIPPMPGYIQIILCDPQESKATNESSGWTSNDTH